MSRKYGRVEVKIWHDEKFRLLSLPAQLMFLYCLTSPHSTAWGAYVLPDLYIEADLGLSKKTIKAAWGELKKTGLVLRCEATNLVAFINWFRYNPPQNADTAKACINGLNALPKSPILSILYKHSGWISEELAKGSLIPNENRRAEMEMEIEIEKEIEMEVEVRDSTTESPASLTTYDENPEIPKALKGSSYFKALAEPSNANLAFFESAIAIESQHEWFDLLKELAKADMHVAKKPGRYAFSRNSGREPPKQTAMRSFLGSWFQNAIKFREQGG